MGSSNLYSYVVDHDLGYAPNPVGGLCTLAYCKFSQSGKRNLVEMAEPGDWVVGTGGKSNESAGHGRLIYAMKITSKIPLNQYLSSRRYAGRADRFPSDSRIEGRFALISDEFWYFGRNAIDVSSIPIHQLNHPFEKRGPAYRADFSEPFIVEFENWIRASYPVGIHGEPCGRVPPHWSCGGASIRACSRLFRAAKLTESV
jgi:Nucleotide modification associated domain 2